MNVYSFISKKIHFNSKNRTNSPELFNSSPFIIVWKEVCRYLEQVFVGVDFTVNLFRWWISRPFTCRISSLNKNNRNLWGNAHANTFSFRRWDNFRLPVPTFMTLLTWKWMKTLSSSHLQPTTHTFKVRSTRSDVTKRRRKKNISGTPDVTLFSLFASHFL